METRQKDIQQENEARDKGAELEGKIGKERAELKTQQDNFHFKLAGLEAEHAQLEEMVDAEAHLDAMRRHTQQEEAHQASEGYSSQD